MIINLLLGLELLLNKTEGGLCRRLPHRGNKLAVGARYRFLAVFGGLLGDRRWDLKRLMILIVLFVTASDLNCLILGAITTASPLFLFICDIIISVSIARSLC